MSIKLYITRIIVVFTDLNIFNGTKAYRVKLAKILSLNLLQNVIL